MAEANPSPGIMPVIAFGVVACVLYGVGAGLRGDIGILLEPLMAHCNATYQQVSFCIAVMNLVFGAAQPAFGMLAARRSNRFVLIAGAGLLGASLVGMAMAKSFVGLLFSLGFLFGTGVGALAFGLILSSAIRRVGPQRALLISGMLNAAAGLGAFVLSPTLQALLSTIGVEQTLLALIAPAALLVPVALLVTSADPKRPGARRLGKGRRSGTKRLEARRLEKGGCAQANLEVSASGDAHAESGIGETFAAERSVDSSGGEFAAVPVGKSVEKPVGMSVEKLANTSARKSAGESAGKPAAASADKPDTLTSKSVGASVSNPVATSAEKPAGMLDLLKSAFHSHTFLMLVVGFTTCGFHMVTIESHLFSQYLSYGIEAASASWAFSLYGIATIAGALLSGWLSTKIRKGRLLAFYYAFRAAWVLAFVLLMPKTLASALLFSIGLGLTGDATVSPTAGLVNARFSLTDAATLTGVLFFFHQIGAFASAWLGGALLDATGSYVALWMLDVALCTLAALASARIGRRAS